MDDAIVPATRPPSFDIPGVYAHELARHVARSPSHLTATQLERWLTINGFAVELANGRLWPTLLALEVAGGLDGS